MPTLLRKNKQRSKRTSSKRILVSVVIPTFNRKEILAKSLGALALQIDPPPFEVLVIDDGSNDGTEGVVNERLPLLPFQVKYFFQQNKGPAAARNKAIREARGEIILFLGDDMIAVPHLLAEHYSWHFKRYPGTDSVVLGPIEWDPSLRITPLMEFLDNGVQFRFHQILGKIDVDFSYFVSSNVSAKKKFIEKALFDTSFPHAAWEDLELAFRLHKKGMKLRLNKEAVCRHDHAVTMRSFQKRSQIVGKTQRLLYARQPELRKSVPEPIPPTLISRIQTVLLGLAYPLFRIFSLNRFLYSFFSLLHKEFVWRGYRESRMDQRVQPGVPV